MRANILILLAGGLLVGGCATLVAASKGAGDPFQGKEAVEARVKEILDKSSVAKECPSKTAEPDKGGILEVTAAADGKLTARSLKWNGDPAIEACLVAAANKVTLLPLPGPAIGTLWVFGAQPPPPDTSNKSIANTLHAFEQQKVNPEADACAQRLLPPEFPADVAISFFIVPGGKTAAVNVVKSTAKDGEYEKCVQKLLQEKVFPDTGYDGPFPAAFQFHAGRLEHQL